MNLLKLDLTTAKHFLSTLLFLLPASIFAATPPNFIIIYTDDLGYADTSVQMMAADPSTKSKFYPTPGLERLADKGVRFTAAYAPTPTCTGSRLSIQHGKSSASMQYRNVFDVLSSVQRPDGYDAEVTMAEMFKGSGKNYITAMFGKGCSAMKRADTSGYDITDENTSGGNGNGHGQWWNPDTKVPFPEDEPKRLHSLRKDSVAFINEYAGKQPFFLRVSHYAVHIPFMATAEAIERNKKRWLELGGNPKELENEKSKAHKDILYSAMIEEMDMNIGAIIDALEAKGQMKNTYIIFTSDNGGGYAERRNVNGSPQRFNGPLQDGKRSIFEGGLRVPTVISGPGIKPGSECDVPIVQWDFLPTFHDLSGSTAPMPEGVDGGSLRAVFKKGNAGVVNRAAPGIVHHYTCHYHPAISSIIIGDFKLMRHLNTGEFKLFNIKTDYREEHDLSKEMPERVATMDAARQKYIDRVDGGSAEQVREAYYKLMDKFSKQSKDGYKKDLAKLKASNPANFKTQKAALLKALNDKLRRNAEGKEHARRMVKHTSFKEGSSTKKGAQEFVRANWVDYTGEE